MVLLPPPLDTPSVAALRAFEAAARLDSFSRAAEELHVTPAAVAQHVKAVEAWAQQPLFVRTARGVSLTDAGHRARPALTDAFRSLGASAALLRDGAAGVTSLRIAALPAVAELWLTPRLGELRELVPGADISIHALDRRPGLQDGFDMVAFYEPDETSTDELVLVAAPDVAAEIRTIDDLAHQTRLRDLVWGRDWATWLGETDRVAPAGTIDVTLFAMAVETARRGGGLLVGRHSLLEIDLERGTLVEPLPRRAASTDQLTIGLREEIARSRIGEWVTASLRRG